MHLRILKMIATSGFLTALKCTKFVFGWGCAQDPTGGGYSAPQTPAGLKGTLLLKGRGEREGERKARGRGERKGRVRPPYSNS